ncbi:SCO1860 family LAETG-anchored protein [Streptomyces sp. SID8352]|uniref:SCO1860 family LAETG-anchored protein n=1 Tax=Streptomyces sp. SID8352 TaxID=2690338 RepID=UPI00136C28A8|nr:SCO1860 family LAETG-anchored protein [Streptomyces sp. SID8352]
MNGNTFRMPAHRLAALAAATVLTAAPAVLTGAGTAHATGDQGRASAAVLRTALDVSLLNRTVNVPLTVGLNEVRAPGNAHRTALSATLDAVDGGRPFAVLRADVAEARADADGSRAEGATRLVNAAVHLPGLPLLSLIEVQQVTATATCEAGRKPVASSNLLGPVTVLGRKTELTAGGTTEVKVPGVGEVRLDLSRAATTSRTAAATALVLKVSVNPLDLNVSEVDGTVTLAEATCEAPPPAREAAEPPAPESPAVEPAAGTAPQGSKEEVDLAETGGSSATPYIAAGAAVLVLGGGGALVLARRRRG